jgi:hypothetical protein
MDATGLPRDVAGFAGIQPLEPRDCLNSCKFHCTESVLKRLLMVVPFIAIAAGSAAAIAQQVFPPELVKFTPYDGNPVFAGTGTGTWDHKIRERGCVLREGDRWHLWYTGYGPQRGSGHFKTYMTSPSEPLPLNDRLRLWNSNPKRKRGTHGA